LLVPDLFGAISAAYSFAASHPNVALVSFAINLVAGLTILVKKLLALDLLLIDHRAERRRRLAKIPPRPARSKRKRSSILRRSQLRFPGTDGQAIEPGR
jgi:hypothetical protein